MILAPGRRISLALATGLALAACSSSSPAPTLDGGGVDGGGAVDGGTPVDGGVPIGEGIDSTTAQSLCGDRWTLLCNAWHDCPFSGEYFPTIFADVAECVTKGSALCMRFLTASYPGVTTSAATRASAISACTTAFAALSTCDLVFEAISGLNITVVPGCAITGAGGTFADGEPCQIADQCQSKVCRAIGNGCATCGQLGAAGDTCTLNTDCQPGMACPGGTCTPYADGGGACPDNPCRPGQACVAGSCGTPLEDDAGCDARAPNPCAIGYCNQGHCERFKLDGQPGGPCGRDPATGTIIGCARGAGCVFYDQQLDGICVKKVPPGGRCFYDQSFQGSQCEVFSGCVNGFCTQGPLPICNASGVSPAGRDGGVTAVIPGADLFAEGVRQVTLSCDALFSCPRLAGIAASWIGERSACDAAFTQILLQTAGAPGNNLNANNLSACNDALEAMDVCDRVDSLFGAHTIPPECHEPAATRQSGEVCGAGTLCGDGSYCQPPSLSATGCSVCATPQPDGGMCGPLVPCGEGLGCAGGHCVPAAADGEVCSASQPCGPNLLCIDGHCGPRTEADGGCDPRADTCAGGLFCDTVKSVCVPVVPAELDGGVVVTVDGGQTFDCGILDGALFFCPPGYACNVTDARQNRGNCVAAAGLGEACSFSGGLDGRGQCKFPGVCMDGVCRIGDPDFCQ